MASQNGEYIDEESGFTDAHDVIQTKARNATWFCEFMPTIGGSDRHIAEVLLWLFNTLGICCAVAGEFATYIGGKLASHPDLITMYIAYDGQKCSSDISIILQLQRALSFSLESLDFWNVRLYHTW